MSLGVIIKNSQISIDTIEKTTIPIVFCSSTPKLRKMIAGGHYQELSLNKILAQALVKKKVSIRCQLVTDEVMKIVSSLQSPIFLTDYEMLFDPRYDIDVIKLFYEMSRRAKVVVKWCGTLNNGCLEYATPEYKDYHSYNINDYDITCVI